MGETVRPSPIVRLLAPPQRGDGLLRDTVWNALVNGALAGLTFFVLLLSSRAAGPYWCGVVALGLAASQQLFALGNFAMQGYQASDVAERRPFSDYVAAKVAALAAMAAAAAAWIVLARLSRDKVLAFLPLLLFYGSDALGLAFFARYWQKGRLDAACRVRFAKLAAFGAVYAAVLAATRRPVPALAAAAVVHAALFFVLDRPLLRLFGPLRWRLPGRDALGILVACSPLAANAFLLLWIGNAPRFAVDAALGEAATGAYSALFAVSFAVAVCGDFFMNPQVVRLARAAQDRDRAAARRIVRRQGALVAGLGAASLAVGAAAGIPVLSAIFGLDLAGRRGTLLVLLAGGVLLAAGQLAQTVLVVLRRQAWALPGTLLAAAVAFFASRPLVAAAGLDGAAAAYLVSVAVLAAFSVAAASVHFRAAFSRPAPPLP